MDSKFHGKIGNVAILLVCAPGNTRKRRFNPGFKKFFNSRLVVQKSRVR